MDNMDVEALVTHYCIAIPHVYPIFPEHRSFEPVLVILDLNLPNLSGFDVLERNPRKEILL
jgi:CheY-like chemotaxis protein